LKKTERRREGETEGGEVESSRRGDGFEASGVVVRRALPHNAYCHLDQKSGANARRDPPDKTMIIFVTEGGPECVNKREWFLKKRKGYFVWKNSPAAGLQPARAFRVFVYRGAAPGSVASGFQPGNAAQFPAKAVSNGCCSAMFRAGGWFCFVGSCSDSAIQQISVCFAQPSRASRETPGLAPLQNFTFLTGTIHHRAKPMC